VSPSLAACGTGHERYFSLNSAHGGTFPSVVTAVNSADPRAI